MLRILVSALLVLSVQAFMGRMGASARNSRLSLEMARKPLIAGNWKMNTDLESAKALAQELVELTKDVNPDDREIAVCPPFLFLTEVSKILETSPQKISLGAQNSFYEDSGAFTGAISGSMIKSVGAKYVLVGHSERRAIFNEDDSGINQVVTQVHNAGLTPILCIGETQEEYTLGLNEEVCTLQLSKGLKGLSPELVAKTVVAYEPVWAIGTGLSATPEIAQSVHAAIRAWLRKTYGNDVADQVIIQYGGSVKPETVDELMKCPDIDGALVGGASLSAKDFARICKFE